MMLRPVRKPFPRMLSTSISSCIADTQTSLCRADGPLQNSQPSLLASLVARILGSVVIWLGRCAPLPSRSYSRRPCLLLLFLQGKTGTAQAANEPCRLSVSLCRLPTSKAYHIGRPAHCKTAPVLRLCLTLESVSGRRVNLEIVRLSSQQHQKKQTLLAQEQHLFSP